MKIEKKVSHWVQEGFITDEQGSRIVEFEHATGKARWMHISLYAFLILGSVVLSIGIISLIAANWEAIPATLKLVTAFGALIGLAAAIYWSQLRGRDIAHDLFATLFALGCLATLGLIAQVFNTGGEALHAIAFWLVIILPISYRGKGMFLPSLWILGALSTFYVWALDSESLWWEHFYYRHDDNIITLLVISLMAMIILAAVSERFTSVMRFSRIFWFLALTACLVSVMSGDVLLSYQVWVDKAALAPLYLLLPLALIALATRRDARRSENALLGVMLAISVLMFVPSFIFSESYDWRYDFDLVGEIAGALFFVVTAAVMALYFAVKGRLWLFHIMTIAIGLRFLIIYLSVFEDLAYTGIGLVVSGLIIIGFAMTWYKYRSRLEIWARGVLA